MTCRTRPVTNARVDVFQSHRPRLFGIAHRMLRSRAEAEDVLQDAYLHWCESETENIRSTIAFLATVTTRLCLDRLRQLKQRRELCVEEAPLPESVADDPYPSPERQLEREEEVAAALLAVLERLGPEERSAFLLHDVFEYDYPEVAQMLGKAEAACRQTIHRARIRIREPRARFSMTAESRERVLRTFLPAVRTGDRNAVVGWLAEEATCAPYARARSSIRADARPKRG